MSSSVSNSARPLALLLPAALFLGSVAFAAAPATAAKPVPAPKDPTALTFKTPSATRGASLFSAGCAGCHGAGGVSSHDTTPSLAGQIPNYLQFQLAAFRAKLRPSNVMQRVAGKLSDQDIADLSAYLSARQPGPAWQTDPAARARGAKLFAGGDAGRNVIACAVCHGENGRGLNANHIASITNLPPAYAVSVLKEFRDSPGFGGLVAPETMRIAVHPLTDADLNDIAAYISSMK